MNTRNRAFSRALAPAALQPILAMLILLTAALTSGAVLAHGIAVWAERVGDQVSVEVHYSNGTAAGNARVQVRDGKGRVLLSTRVGPDGRAVLAVPQRERLLIRATSGNGHSSAVWLDQDGT